MSKIRSSWAGVCLSALTALTACTLMSVQTAKAQVLYGSVVGTVTDQSGAVLPNAQVTVTNEQTGFTRQATSNASGQYRIIEVPEGDYTISVSATGFQEAKRTGVRLVIGQVNQQDVTMQVGGVTQEVTVQGSAQVLQTQRADVHTTISSYAVQNLPLNVYNNFQSLEILAPGVFSMSGISGAYPNSLADTPDRSFAINTNGLPQHINTSRVDGATDIFIWLPDHMVIVPPAATVEEVNVQTSNFNVQKGLTAGAATDVVTKSGTNQFHGLLYGTHTDQAIDAQNLFVHVPTKPKNIQNNFGASVGGPIKKDKLFFFGNWDGFFQRQDATDTLLLPPVDMRNGDFTSYLGSKLYNANGSPAMTCTTEGQMVQLQEGMVFDPTSGNTATGQGRCVFSSGGIVNMIPSGRIYSGSQAYWQLLAPYTPNQPGAFTQFTAENDIRLRKSDWNRNVYTGKIDYNISDRQTLWGKYTLQKALLNDGSDYGVAGVGNGTGITDDTAQTMTIGHTWTVKPTLVLTGHVGFTRMGENNTTADFGTNYGQTVLGLVNSNTPANDTRYSGMPGLFISEFGGLGSTQSWEPVFRNDWTLTLDEHATSIHGNHEIVYGFDAAHNHLNHWQPEIVCCPRGALSTYDDNTFLNTAAAGDATGAQAQYYDSTGTAVGFNSAPWNGAALFDLGLASEVYNGQQFIKATNKDWQEAFYIGDTYRLTPKLTVDAGVRWEYYPVITRDGASKFEVYDVNTNLLQLGGLGGNSTHLGVTSSKKLFAPRLGLAYRLKGNTVIRSAFGITYDTLPIERPLRGFYPYTIGADQFVTGNSNVTRFLPYSNFDASGNTVNAIPGLTDGVPLIATPTGFEQGAITPPPDVTIGTLAPGAFKRGYVEQWNFTIERELPKNILLSVGYVGNHLVHEFNGQEANAAPLGTGSDGQPLFAAFGRFSDTYLFQGYLDSHYNALQVSLTRHVGNGLFLQGSYTYSKAIGYMDDEGWEDGLYFQCPASAALPQGCQSLNRHTLSFDHTHVLKMAFVYGLPFGSGKKWANSGGAASAILGGWQTNGVFSAWTGAPLFPSQTSSFLNTPFSSQVPDFSGSLTMPKNTGPGAYWFDPTSFTPDQTVSIGTGGRGLSWLRGPGLGQLDFSVFRNFKLTERFGLRFSLETLNLTNTPHFNNPNTSCSIVNGECGGGFGQITSSFGERIIQLGAQVSF